jgi:hypothetical protein
MLTKNIYILFPPGYSGTYVQWAISKSEKDLSSSTVDDPVNRSTDNNYGGVGTAHYHTRIPTHQNLQQHLTWVIRNQPKEKRIYILNAHQTQSGESTIDKITWYDPDPVFIYIHDSDDMDRRKYGAINALTKWPIFFKANQVIQKRFNFDSFNCDNSLDARNLFYKQFDRIFPFTRDLDIAKIKYKMDWNYHWYKTRNFHNPHEVNSDYYLEPKLELPKIYSICLTDIVNPSFVTWLKEFFSSSESGDYNIEHVENYHQTYIDAQPNLKLFSELINFRKTFTLTDYLRSHSLLQSYAMMELGSKINNKIPWKTMDIDSIVSSVVK